MRAFQRASQWLLVVFATALLAACATGPQVRTDYDPTADFTQYRTWSFYSPIAMEEYGYSTWISERIKDNVRKQMDARGYRYVEASPDLQVNFQGIVQDRTAVFSMPRSDVQWLYDYRRNAYVGVPVWYDDTQVSRYREGTLTVDLVDARRNRMVWTGAAIGRVVRKTPEEQMAGVDEAINAIFMQYPHRAGSP
jgi:Domain of unknown function (DUF4136)